METKIAIGKRLLIFTIFISMLNWSNYAWNLRPKDLKVENIKQCPIDEDSPIVIDVFDITQPERQKYALNATIRILSDIDNHIYFKMNLTKCSFSRFKCDDLDTLATPNVCKNLNSPNTLWSSVVKTLQPPLTCPLKAGVYHVENSFFDLGIITRTPTEPGKILVNLSFFDYPHETERRKRLLICLAVEVTITQAKSLGGTISAPQTHAIKG
ncbi:uncharacterized protein LOC129566650 [Sitodiplosis mosellana]|uniref:uncharacterized protein LOC129566650 n=1 Tax=Sitodiplosis mosellana TaxID=263140 RepID=UPI00244455EC|nr:uncharacterized protein LOC129566650 [Sitodiplosis mosellana]